MLSGPAKSGVFNPRRGTQVVRERSAKPLCVGSIPTRASINSILSLRSKTAKHCFRYESLCLLLPQRARRVPGLALTPRFLDSLSLHTAERCFRDESQLLLLQRARRVPGLALTSWFLDSLSPQRQALFRDESLAAPHRGPSAARSGFRLRACTPAGSSLAREYGLAA
jgi:hypothetical protein